MHWDAANTLIVVGVVVGSTVVFRAMVAVLVAWFGSNNTHLR